MFYFTTKCTKGHRTTRASIVPSATATAVATNNPLNANNVQNQNGQGDHVENISTATAPLGPRNRNNQRQSTAAPTTGVGQQIPAPMGTANARRSYVVKEVERLKENREKRRARQAELKEEKVALMNLDPGNPNWELAAMIRLVSFNLGVLLVEIILIY